MEEAEQLCDRIAIMDDGRIVAMGTLEELLRLRVEEIVVERPRGLEQLFIQLTGKTPAGLEPGPKGPWQGGGTEGLRTRPVTSAFRRRLPAMRLQAQLRNYIDRSRPCFARYGMWRQRICCCYEGSQGR